MRGRWWHKEVGHPAVLAVGSSGLELPEEEGTTAECLVRFKVDEEVEPMVVIASRVSGKGGRRIEQSSGKGGGEAVKWKLGSHSCPPT
jgi:hypothetical protein